MFRVPAYGGAAIQWIDFMQHAFPRPLVRQFYVLEPDSGVLVRILSLYAARGMPFVDISCRRATTDEWHLQVTTEGECLEALRVLREKAATCVGVLHVMEESRPSREGEDV